MVIKTDTKKLFKYFTIDNIKLLLVSLCYDLKLEPPEICICHNDELIIDNEKIFGFYIANKIIIMTKNNKNIKYTLIHELVHHLLYPKIEHDYEFNHFFNEIIKKLNTNGEENHENYS
jgi:Zn-dependent peptidase ImmA (M78 family)